MKRRIFAGIQDKMPINVKTLNTWRNLMRHKQNYDPSVFDVCDQWCLFSEFEAWTLFNPHGDTLAHIGHVSDPIYHSEATSAMVDASLAKFLSDRNTRDYTRYAGVYTVPTGDGGQESVYSIHRPSDGVKIYGSRSSASKDKGGQSEYLAVKAMYNRKRVISAIYSGHTDDYPEWIKSAIRWRYMDVLVNSDLTLGKKGLTARNSRV